MYRGLRESVADTLAGKTIFASRKTRAINVFRCMEVGVDSDVIVYLSFMNSIFFLNRIEGAWFEQTLLSECNKLKRALGRRWNARQNSVGRFRLASKVAMGNETNKKTHCISKSICYISSSDPISAQKPMQF